MSFSGTKEEQLEKRREYYKNNAAKIKEGVRKSYAKRDPELHREKKREYYKANPERQKAASKKWAENNGYRNPSPEQNRLNVRAYRLKHKYKMTQGEWDALFTSQGNKCAICFATEPGTKYHWNTDHCHDTGVVRGILCHRCNALLLRHGTTADTLRAAADYLER